MLDNLTRDVLAAEKAGMSYGQWKAIHPHTKPAEPRRARDEDGKVYRRCCICGAKFEVKYYNHVLCSDECRRERNRQHNNTYQEKYRKERAANIQNNKED